MNPKNNAGYTLMEMIIVLSITSTILLFFTHSLMNNFHLIHQAQKRSLSFIKLQVLKSVQKDGERSFRTELKDDSLELREPFRDDENRFTIRQVDYQQVSNRLLRRETGDEEKQKWLDLDDLQLNFDIGIISNVSNLFISFIDTNGITDTYSQELNPRQRPAK